MAYRVLIVDDSPAMRAFIRRVMESSGFELSSCFEAGNGEESRSVHAWNIQLSRALIERRDEMPVLDVVAEDFQSDFRGGKRDLRRAQQPLRIVDDAD